MSVGPRTSRILFLCAHNSCRSQMAEAWTRHIKPDEFVPFSAGIEASRVDPRAITAMAEAGIDISNYRSKSTDEFAGERFDFIVTVCDAAREQCPFFPGEARRVHAGFDDPPALAAGAETEDEALSHYRRVRDEIRAFVEGMPGTLEEDKFSG